MCILGELDIQVEFGRCGGVHIARVDFEIHSDFRVVFDWLSEWAVGFSDNGISGIVVIISTWKADAELGVDPFTKAKALKPADAANSTQRMSKWSVFPWTFAVASACLLEREHSSAEKGKN